MALTDLFVRNVKHSGAPAGDKYADGGGMYLLVKSTGKYWRMGYRFVNKRKTLALGVYPNVSLAQARKRGFSKAPDRRPATTARRQPPHGRGAQPFAQATGKDPGWASAAKWKNSAGGSGRPNK